MDAPAERALGEAAIGAADHPVAPDHLVWFAPDGSSEQVPVPWSGSSIAAIEVSRDSTRMAALLSEGG